MRDFTPFTKVPGPRTIDTDATLDGMIEVASCPADDGEGRYVITEGGTMMTMIALGKKDDTMAGKIPSIKLEQVVVVT